MNVKWSDIPGYREAIKRENDIRDAAFLDLTTNICGIEIRQMTLRDLMILEGIGNPIVVGGLPTPEELVDFLWKLSPRFGVNALWRRFWFARKARKVNYVKALQACHRYMEDTLQDSPASSGQQSMPYASMGAHIINTISINYGWTESAILWMPLKRTFQYLKCIRRYHNPECPMHNPSDKVRGNFVRLLSARFQLLNALNRRAAN